MINPENERIWNRLSFYEQCEELPPEAKEAIEKHYKEDVADLLQENQQLYAFLNDFVRLLFDIDDQIEALQKENETLTDRLSSYFEKYNWYKDVFEPSVTVGDAGRERRITDNRQNWQKKQGTVAE
jgi:hypothetical protein